MGLRLIIFLLLCPVIAQAKPKIVTVTDTPTVVEKGGARRIFISGFAGQVVVLPGKSTEILVKATRYVEGDDALNNAGDLSEVLRQIAVKATNNAGTIEIRTILPPNRSDWTKWAQGKNIPQVKLEVSAPDNMNLEIYWARGDVKVTKWKAGVVITHQTGKLTLEDISGDVTARTMYGIARFENIKGSMSIENFASQLNVGQVTGKLKLRTFSGETQIRKILGNSVISTQKASVVTQDTQGPMEIQTGIAAISIANHRGSIRGQTDTGSVTAKLTGQIDARFNSNSGALLISIPRSSRADVSLSTNKGDLKAPKNLDHKRTSAGKIVRGRLSGSESGAIRMNSDAGDINLRVL